DLEVQLERELNAEERDLRAEEERQRLGRLTIRTRLVSLTLGPTGPAVFRVELSSGDAIVVRPTTLGRDWLAADLIGPDESREPPGDAAHRQQRESGAGMRRSDRATPQCVLPFSAIAGIVLTAHQMERSLGDEAESPSASRLSERIGLPFVLRDLCRRRAAIELRMPAGMVNGTIDRVGRDHLDLAVHPPGTLRRTPDVYQYRVVPLAHILLVTLD
ncbi:hypothetical protein GY21_12245, partial [Cryobacterium roopkundense]